MPIDTTREIRILMLEQVAAEADLVERYMRDEGMSFEFYRVESEDEFKQALQELHPSIILISCQLCRYSGRDALIYARQHFAETPVVMLSDESADEAVAEFFQHGAVDYLAKRNRARLVSAVRRALSEQQSTLKRRQAESALKASELRYRRLFETSSDGILILDGQNGVIIDANPFILQLLSYRLDEVIGRPLWDIGLMAGERAGKDMLAELKKAGFAHYDELPLPTKSGKRMDVELNCTHYTAGDQQVIQCNIRDISERKHLQEIERVQARALRLISKCNMVLVQANEEGELLSEICKLTVECGGYMMAWVGIADDDEGKSVRPVAKSGYEDGYLDGMNITWADSERGQGPTGTAIRTGKTSVNQNCLTNPKMAPWLGAMTKRGYQSSIALPLIRGQQRFGALTIYSAQPYAFGEEEVALLEELARDLAYGIESLRTRAAHSQSEEMLRKSLEQSIQTIAGTLEARDPYTAGHQRRVADLAKAIASEMGLSEQKIHGLHLAATIHDLGKISIPAEILAKPGRLTDIEFMLMKTHPQAGFDILKEVQFPWPIAEIILQHHERMDGSGYPRGLKGEEILLEARIIAIADVVEAISSHRPYRASLGLDQALDEISRHRGSYFDPVAVDACLKLFRSQGYKLFN